MEVVSHSDHDTHSIMGGGKRHAATINANSGLITTLSTSLYSDNFLATVRETICNGWDAHKVSGRKHIPLEINIDPTTLTIKDFGLGIPHDKMGPIYMDYGGSTKVASIEETGGFGLGSKSPFSYTDFFNVENNHGGIKGVYTVSRGSSETNGMPDIIEMIRVPTTDEGLTVEIPIDDPRDVPKFKQVIMGVISLGGINAKLNGEIIPVADYDSCKEGILFTDRKPYIVNGLLYVRYGNVIYPIKSHRDYADLFLQATEIMKNTAKTRKSGWWDEVREPLIAIFDAKPNTISVVPSREDLHSSPRTVNTVRGFLEKFIEANNPLQGSEYILQREKLIIQKMIDEKKDLRDILLDTNIIMKEYKQNRDRFYDFRGDFMSVDELIIGLAANGYFYDKETLKKARAYRMEMAVKHSITDKDLLGNLQDMLRKYPSIWDNSHYCSQPSFLRFINPILRRAASASLNPKNLILWDDKIDAGRRAYGGKPLYQTLDEFKYLVSQTKRLVMLVNRKSQIMQYQYKCYQPDNWSLIPEEGCLVYVMPGKYKPKTKSQKKPGQWADYKQTLEFFKKQNYVVIDCVKLDIEAQERAALLAPLNPPKLPVVQTIKKPKNQYLSLMNLKDENGIFDRRRHLDVDRAKLTYVSKPVAIMQAQNIGKNTYAPKFFKFGDSYAPHILKLYGDKLAIAKTVLEYDKAIKDGSVDGYDWLIKQVCDDILSNKAYKEYRELIGIWENHPWISPYTYERIKLNTKTGARLPDIPTASKFDNTIVDLFDHLKGNAYRSYFTEDQKKLLLDTEQAMENWYKEPTIDYLKGVFAEDAKQRIQQVSLHNILNSLESTMLSARDRAFNETLLSITLFG